MSKCRKVKATPQATPKTKKHTWRSLPDELILCMSKRSWTTAPSLHPDEHITIAAASGNEYAVEIVKAWKFEFPITVVPSV